MALDLSLPIPLPPNGGLYLSRLGVDAKARIYLLVRQQTLSTIVANLFVRRENKRNWSRFVGSFQRCSEDAGQRSLYATSTATEQFTVINRWRNRFLPIFRIWNRIGMTYQREFDWLIPIWIHCSQQVLLWYPGRVAVRRMAHMPDFGIKRAGDIVDDRNVAQHRHRRNPDQIDQKLVNWFHQSSQRQRRFCSAANLRTISVWSRCRPC